MLPIISLNKEEYHGNAIKNIARAFIITLTCATMAVALVACGSDNPDEAAIRDSLTEELDSIKNYDTEEMEGILSSLGMPLEDFGITAADICDAWLNSFEYSINGVIVTIDGEEATATVTISCVPLIDAMYTWSDNILSDSSIYSMEEEELYAYFGSSLIEAISSHEIITSTVELPYVFADDGWYADDGWDDAVYTALFGDL